MTLFGIEIRKPTFNEATASVVMGIGLWMAVLGIARASGHGLDVQDAGALLVLAVWASVGARIGLGIDKSRRHLIANIGVSSLLLALYQGAITIVA